MTARRGRSRGTAAAADAPVTTIAKKKKEKECRKGYVRKRVKLTKGRMKGKRVSRCVQKRKKPAVRHLAPV